MGHFVYDPTMNTATQTFVIGVVCGMRSTFGPALVSHKLSGQGVTGRRETGLSVFSFMASPKTANFLKIAAAGELIADKLPQTPARTQPGPLVGRALSGALCGAALGRAAGSLTSRGARTGAVVGALGAVTGSYAFYYLRHYLTDAQNLPDLPVALTEDALAAVGGAVVLDEI